MANKNKKDEIKDFIDNAKKLKEQDYNAFTKIFYMMKGIQMGKTGTTSKL